ncbi:hypothetical protein ES702_05947 [subsurface metagenome]
MAEGHIGSVLGTLVCNATLSEFPSVAHVYGDIYAICWDEGGTECYICTVNIPSTGLNPTLIDGPFKGESTVCHRPRIIKVATSVYAYVYKYNLDHGLIRTITITNGGNIIANIDSFDFEGVNCGEPEICEVAPNVFVVVYVNTNSDGKIVTIGIDDQGQIAEPLLDSWVFDAGYIRNPDVLKIASNIFAFFYGDFVWDGWVKTIGISDLGSITESIIDFLNFETSTAYYINAAHFTGNIYAAAYHDGDNDGWVTTIEILPNGQIAASYADRLEFSPGYGMNPSIIGVTSNVMAIAYEESASDGEIYTFLCLSDGDITTAPRDTQNFDSTAAAYPYIFHVTAGIYAVAYLGENDYITLKTFDIARAGFPKHLPFMGMG